MKQFKKFLEEGVKADREELTKKMTDDAHTIYNEVGPDLPKHGNYHYDSAVGHIADRLYDKYHSHPTFNRKHHNLQKIAKNVVSKYADNDTKESDKRYAPKKERKPREKKEPKPKPVKVKYRKGVGSY